MTPRTTYRVRTNTDELLVQARRSAFAAADALTKVTRRHSRENQ